MLARWHPPTAGEIVWCKFPTEEKDQTKPRPGLIVRVTLSDTERKMCWVTVAYGTSQKTAQLYAGEFLISKTLHPEAYRLAGLSHDTKFNFKRVATLPFTQNYFAPPPHAPNGDHPKMGLLHPSLASAARAAYLAASTSPPAD
jgi:mRNA-degrading endonuclease toxin of MazEF toxin-antitoxin module